MSTSPPDQRLRAELLHAKLHAAILQLSHDNPQLRIIPKAAGDLAKRAIEAGDFEIAPDLSFRSRSGDTPELWVGRQRDGHDENSPSWALYQPEALSEPAPDMPPKDITARERLAYANGDKPLALRRGGQ
jgi:hypothetical protein